MARMQEAAAASDARVKSLEASVTSAKEQYLRLNADFDNFRRRTVRVCSCMRACCRPHVMAWRIK